MEQKNTNTNNSETEKSEKTTKIYLKRIDKKG